MLTIAPKTFVAASRGASVVSSRRAGAEVSFTLNTAATVRFTVVARLAGRKSGGRCVKPTKANRHRHACTRVITKPGSFRRTGARGTNHFRFTGRLSGLRLTPGAYQLVGAPSASGKTGHAARASFEIVK
jgi:hypothetical protein